MCVVYLHTAQRVEVMRMANGKARLWVLVGLGLPWGCAPDAHGPSQVGRVAQALSLCDEEVPPDRMVDGIPAYSQCPGLEDVAIYSNNGVDTSETRLGDDWHRTQWSGGYQCTELANRYLRFVWDVTWIPRGNAGTWCDSPPPDDSGLVQTMEPMHGDLMVFPPGSCGADPRAGHVAVIDVAEPSGRLTIVEQNRAGRRRADPSCAGCFLHVVANDGAGDPPSMQDESEAGPSESGSAMADPPPPAEASPSGTPNSGGEASPEAAGPGPAPQPAPASEPPPAAQPTPNSSAAMPAAMPMPAAMAAPPPVPGSSPALPMAPVAGAPGTATIPAPHRSPGGPMHMLQSRGPAPESGSCAIRGTPPAGNAFAWLLLLGIAAGLRLGRRS